MNDSWYAFDVAPEWVILALIAAMGCAVLLYSRKNVPWGKTNNAVLGFLRFAAVFLIMLLLLNPLLQLFLNEEESPIVVIALDNSESVIQRSGAADKSAISEWLNITQNDLSSQYQIYQHGLSKQIGDSITFDAQTTNLSKLLKNIENIYQDQNLGAVVLASDGIINEGQSPAYQNYVFPVFTIGLGDTIPPRDITIKSIRHNKVAYQGNRFPVEITINQKGYSGTTLVVTIREGTRTKARREVTLSQPTQNIDFLLNADEAGLHRYTVEVEEQSGESSWVNNRQELIVDVIEGKDRVLILASAPHPDINAIRSVLSSTSNYETQVYIPNVSQRPSEKEFDLIIEHQAFSGTSYGSYEANGKWYILGSRPNLGRMADEISYMGIQLKGNGKDQVRGSYNEDFTKFRLNEELTSRLKNYPPIEVPFGEYQLAGPVEVLLWQQVGSITSDRPLLVFFDDGTQKSAIMTGSGLWQWRLQEAGSEDRAELFSDLILKTVQYLSIQVSKDQFVAKPREANYQIGDRVFIDTEVYNEIYERSYGNTIQLTLTDEQDNSTNYEMVDSEVNSSFNLGALEPGIYGYTAHTKTGGKSLRDEGSFVIRDVQLESVNLTANHNLLKSLAIQTGGSFYTFQDAQTLIEALKNQSYQTVIHTHKEAFPLINSLWVILLIVLLLSVEWLLRKYWGAY